MEYQLKIILWLFIADILYNYYKRVLRLFLIKEEKNYGNRIKQAYSLELIDENKIDSSSIFANKIKPLPFDKLPIVIAGGSFNTAHIKTKTNANNKKVIDKLLKELDPKKVYFVIGNKLNGYEKYLVNKNTKYDIYAFVPSLISKVEAEALNKENIHIRVSTEMLRMGLYKSFNYEIFKRIPSVVIVFDGSSAAANLIQEAINGKPKSLIYINKETKNDIITSTKAIS